MASRSSVSFQRASSRGQDDEDVNRLYSLPRRPKNNSPKPAEEEKRDSDFDSGGVKVSKNYIENSEYNDDDRNHAQVGRDDESDSVPAVAAPPGRGFEASDRLKSKKAAANAKPTEDAEMTSVKPPPFTAPRARPINDDDMTSLKPPPRKPDQVSTVARLPDKMQNKDEMSVARAPDRSSIDALDKELQETLFTESKKYEYQDQLNLKTERGATGTLAVKEHSSQQAYAQPDEQERDLKRPESWKHRFLQRQSESKPGATRVGDIESEGSSVSFIDGDEMEAAVAPGDAKQDGIVSAYPVEEATEAYPAEPISHRRVWFAATAAIVVIAGIVVPVALLFGKDNGGSDEGDINFEVIITGLCSPRHLKVFDETLFVAESGVGPMVTPDNPETSDLCLDSTVRFIPDDICYGLTGQISAFDLNGNMAGEPLTGLFSARPVRGAATNQVYGVAAVDFDENGNMFSLVGLGYINATELALRDPELSFAAVFRGDEAVAYPWVTVVEENPAQAAVVESNPFHMILHRGVTYIVDAGADLLFTYLNVNTAGTAEPDSVIVLPRIDNIPAVEPNPRADGSCNNITPPRGPPFCGQTQDDAGNWFYSASPVPTAIRVNPKFPDRIYIAYLSGAIWNAPVSGIFYMDLVDGIPQLDTLKDFKGGFWAIIDIDFYEGDLLVLEANPGGFVPFEGRLSRVKLDSSGAETSRIVVSESLAEPAGLIVHGNNIYVTNSTFNKGKDDCRGQIIKGRIS